jgi:hypothetical protein
MAGSDKDHGKSRRPGAEDRGWSTIGRILNGRTIERSVDTMCGLYRAHGDREHKFLGCASKPRLIVCQWFGFKTTKTGFSVWASKSAPMV